MTRPEIPTGDDRRPETDAKERARIKRLDRQIGEIMGSDAYIDALEEAQSGEAVRAKVKENPKAFFEAKGIRFPDEVELEYGEGNSWYCCGWYYLRNRYGNVIGYRRYCNYYW